jgi:hypothetical protein
VDIGVEKPGARGAQLPWTYSQAIHDLLESAIEKPGQTNVGLVSNVNALGKAVQNGSKQVDLPFTPLPPAALLRLTHLINVPVAEAPFPYNIAEDPTSWRNEGARIARDTLSIDRLDTAGEFEFENPN